MEPKFISGIENLNKVVYDNKEKIIMFLFTASWCGPCKQLKKDLYHESTPTEGICHEFSKTLHVLYLDADDEENEELLNIYEITALPTQVLVRLNSNSENNDAKIEVLDKIEGGDVISLRMKLEKHCLKL